LRPHAQFIKPTAPYVSNHIHAANTWFGFYLTQLIVSAATLFFTWFYTIMSLSGATAGVLAPPPINSIIPNSMIVIWIAQLGGIFLAPLVALLILERGWLRGLWRSLHLILAMGPLFFVCHQQTRAYYVDRSIALGRSTYLATGRDFVIRHLSHKENWTAVGLSHYYIGMEMLFLLVLMLVYGTFTSAFRYVVFFAGAWVFTLSLLFGVSWFNPFNLELKYLLRDFGEVCAQL